MNKLTEAERDALTLLKNAGAVLVSYVENKTKVDCLGRVVPGWGVFRKLIKKGFVIQTVEDPMDDGFTFTEELYITDEGLNALNDV
jgi:hypothetical protein